MLNVKTSVENGTAMIYIYDSQELISGLKHPSETDEEAYEWLANRGVNSVENFETFIQYVLLRGEIGEKATALLNKDAMFLLNQQVGICELDVETRVVGINCRRYSA